ncbi:hypothetical protein D3C73_1243540 [compost metagenome]
MPIKPSACIRAIIKIYVSGGSAYAIVLTLPAQKKNALLDVGVFLVLGYTELNNLNCVFLMQRFDPVN